ncbi:glycoside hydrolase family 5 protein [Streptomyces sp. T028]|uniref:glycoside hydrolase family 5 protein n=1 Tax=Streptomyces sp. T028 TaxID=3394379 RepID=UPI003A858590
MPSTHSRARRVAWTSLALAATVGFLSASPAHAAGSGTAPRAKTPVQTYGKLHVCGTQLCGASGKAVQLRGMSTHGTQWYPQCLTGAALNAVAHDWKASVLRVSTYAREGAYRADPKKYTDLASKLVDMASARGMYVIVDWHTIHPGDPHADLANARAFFKAIAEKHKNKNNVIYEVANEPHGVSWSTIKAYTEKIMPVIRSRAPGSVILVPTRGWATLGAAEATNEKVILADPVRDKNVMYTYHFYATAGREQFLKLLDRASDKLPIFVTEWAVASWNGWGTDYPMAQKFIDLMAKKKIGWTNWSLSDNHKDLSVFKKGACSTGKFGKAALSPNGVWVRDRIRG